MENAMDNYWAEMNDTITNYNDRNHTPLSNVKIREAIDKVMLKEKQEANNVTVDTFSTQINGSEDLIGGIANITINNIRNNLISCVINMTIKDAGNALIGGNASDIQVQFAGNQAGKTHQTC